MFVHLQYINNFFGSLSNRIRLTIILTGIFLLGIFDYLIGPELSFSVFYTVPIMLGAWYGGKRVGYSVAIVSALVWFSADMATGVQYSSNLIPVWNTLVRLCFFLIILWLLLIVQEKLSAEESLADTDHLTGLANRRFFYEQLDREHARLNRYPGPVTIAYLDLDNFKYINDSMGHDVGDVLLQKVAQCLRKNIRASDFTARLGGDEFAILFPLLEQDAALPLLEKLQAELLLTMQEQDWPVTFSIGAITFNQMLDFSRDMIKKVDDLMYDVKKSGKNNIRHDVTN